jgi:hypothetical protein
MASRFILPLADVGNGISPSDGAKLTFFITGTSILKDTYSDEAKITPNTNPVIADGDGLFPEIWIDGSYKVTLTDKNDEPKWEEDPIHSTLNSDDIMDVVEATENLPIIFTNYADLVSGTLPDGDPIALTAGQNARILGRVTEGDGGDNTYLIGTFGTANAGSIVDLDSGLQAKGLFPGGVHNIKQYGATGDAVTDDTTAFHAFRDSATTGQELYVPTGTYLVNILLWNFPMTGVGANASRLRAFNTANPIITLASHTPLWMWYKISGIQFDGVDKSGDGVYFGTDVLTICWRFVDCEFVSCNKGVDKDRGNIGNKFDSCHFFGNNFGYHATGIDSSPDFMQAGSDLFTNCEWDSNLTAGVYVNSPIGGSGQTKFDHCLFQDVVGMSIFVLSFQTAISPFTIEDCWFESPPIGGTVTIDSIVYTVRNIYVADCEQMEIKRSRIMDVELAGDATVRIDSCFLNENTSIVTTASDVLRVSNAQTDSYIGLPLESLTGFVRKSGAASDVYVCSPRLNNTLAVGAAGTLISANDFANEEQYSWTGTTTETGFMTPDGVLFDSCCEIDIPNGNTNFGDGTGGTITTGKFLAWSVDIKPTTSNIPTITIANGTTLAVSLDLNMIEDQWNHRAGVTEAQTTGTIGLKVVNSTGSVSTLRVSAYQVVEFDKKIDAINYFNDRCFMPDKQRRITQGTAAPTTGTWAVGDTVIYNNPVAAGKAGTKCTVAGTPGTWNEYGVIDA